MKLGCKFTTISLGPSTNQQIPYGNLSQVIVVTYKVGGNFLGMILGGGVMLDGVGYFDCNT